MKPLPKLERVEERLVRIRRIFVARLLARRMHKPPKMVTMSGYTAHCCWTEQARLFATAPCDIPGTNPVLAGCCVLGLRIHAHRICALFGYPPPPVQVLFRGLDHRAAPGGRGSLNRAHIFCACMRSPRTQQPARTGSVPGMSHGVVGNSRACSVQ